MIEQPVKGYRSLLGRLCLRPLDFVRERVLESECARHHALAREPARVVDHLFTHSTPGEASWLASRIARPASRIARVASERYPPPESGRQAQHQEGHRQAHQRSEGRAQGDALSMAIPNLGTLSQPLPVGGQTPGAAAPAPATGQSSPDGKTAMSRGKVMQAIQSISMELPNFPVGSEEHTALLDTVKKLGKYFSGWSTSAQAAPQPQQAAQQIAGSPVPLPGSAPNQEAA